MDSETFRDATFTKETRDKLVNAAHLLRALSVNMPAASPAAEAVQEVVTLWDQNDATEMTLTYPQDASAGMER